MTGFLSFSSETPFCSIHWNVSMWAFKHTSAGQYSSDNNWNATVFFEAFIRILKNLKANTKSISWL